MIIRTKVFLRTSIVINILFIYSRLFSPQRLSMWAPNSIINDKNFNIGWYVKWINFQMPSNKSSEYYIIFWTPTGDSLESWKYYYINWITYEKGSSVNTNLKELKVRSNSKEKIELFDSTYIFEIYKESGKVIWKDKNWDMFELVNFKKTFWYQRLF